MKFLSILNVSNYEDINSDSGFIFNYLLANELVEDNNEFGIVLPFGIEKIDNFKKAKVFYIDMGKTKYESRFCFDYHGLKKVLLEYKPDFIFLNQCELASSVKAMIISNSLNNTKIISYCHYPAIHVDDNNKPIFDSSLNDCNLCESIIFDIFNSINISDVFLIQSNFAKSLLLEMAKKYNVTLSKSIHIIPPPYDPFMLQDFNIEVSSKNDNIIYNHRLYKSYGTEKLLQIIDKNSNYSFIVTNPMVNRSKKRAKFNQTPQQYAEILSSYKNVTVVDGSKSRSQYKEYLLQGRLAIAPARKACVWSMSAIDAICVGIPVIAPNYASFIEFIPDYLRFNSIDEALKLIDLLFNDAAFYEKAIVDSRKILDNLSPIIAYNKLKQLIYKE